tara:strand:- start:2009 stop:2455 length:447 start_codon:yes stop_codon:yes gene_type:complete
MDLCRKSKDRLLVYGSGPKKGYLVREEGAHKGQVIKLDEQKVMILSLHAEYIDRSKYDKKYRHFLEYGKTQLPEERVSDSLVNRAISSSVTFLPHALQRIRSGLTSDQTYEKALGAGSVAKRVSGKSRSEEAHEEGGLYKPKRCNTRI